MTTAELINPANRQRVREMLPQLEAAARANPKDHYAVLHFAVACMVLDETELSARVLEELFPQAPDNGALAAHLAQALANVGRYEDSLKIYEHAMKIRPQSHELHVGYGIVLLRLGQFSKGWEHYEHRDFLPNLPQFMGNVSIPRYSGGNLGGKTIYLIGEQGIGDTIQMIRYIPMLARRGARIMLAAHPAMCDLLRCMRDIWAVFPLGQRTPAPFDTYARLFSLPRIFGTTEWNIPNQVPYLKPDPTRVEQWRKRFASDGNANTKRVGLVWAGNPAHLGDARRSLHLHDLAPLADMQNITFYSLQKGDREAEAQNPPAGMQFVNLSPELKDFSDLAAVLEVLDLFITVDTGPAHLAGALGRPVWNLIPYVPDWRWMVDRGDSPWYPTMTLFRQPKLADWTSVIAHVRDELCRFSQGA